MRLFSSFWAFFDGDFYDAKEFLCSLVARAKNDLVVIDPYFDVKGLAFLTKLSLNISKKIVISSKSKLTDEDVKSFVKQYGDVAIVGANAVVGSNIPPYTIAVGNPAKVIKKRFDDEMIDLLERLKWWNKTPKQVQNLIPLLSNSDIIFVKKQLIELLK